MTDSVHHPEHYTGFSNGAEVIDITENLNFNRGNVVKYIARAGKKNPDTEIQDLEKAQWYLNREFDRLRAEDPEKYFADKPTYSFDVQTLTNKTILNAINYIDPRKWDLLDHVPPGVIVEDRDGDYYRRIQGTGQFEISTKEDTYGQHYEWQKVWPFIYREQSNYAPFTEVTT